MGPISSEFNELLFVLAITVIVDEKIRSPEINEFCEQACGLAELYADGEFTINDAKAWFEKHKPMILDKINGRGRNTYILKSISAVKDPAMRENLYDAMITISISDSEYHKHESDLVRSAGAIWGFSRPPLKVAEAE